MDRLKQLAQQLESIDVTNRLSQADALMSRAPIHVGIVGLPNSGKSNLINGLFHQEIRPVSVIPSSCPPLRIVFDRTEDDPRFECVHILNQEWNEAGAILYELSVEDIQAQKPWVDEMDMFFYLSPITRFMTSDDRNVLALLDGMPVKIIATKCDQVPAEDLEKNKGYIRSACERLHLSEPIFAMEDAWTTVSEEMRRALPTTSTLVEARTAHYEIIKERCRQLLIEQVQQLLAIEKRAQGDKNSAYIEQLRKYELDEATRNRQYKEMKLRCSNAGNETLAQISTAIQHIEAFGQKTIEDGQKCKFDAEFIAPLQEQLNRLLDDELRSISNLMNTRFSEISRDALQQDMITEAELRSILPQFQPTNIRQSNLNLEASGDSKTTHIVQGVGIVAAIGVISFIAHVPPALSVAALSGATIFAGGNYIQRTASDRTDAIEKEIRNWYQSCTMDLQATVTPTIQRIFQQLNDALHCPSVAKPTMSEPVASERTQELQRLLSELQA